MSEDTEPIKLMCNQKDCDKPAEYVVFWPGQETLQCKDHAFGLRNLASHMGFNLAMRLITDGE